jgi:hypothetical protein
MSLLGTALLMGMSSAAEWKKLRQEDSVAILSCSCAGSTSSAEVIGGF